MLFGKKWRFVILTFLIFGFFIFPVHAASMPTSGQCGDTAIWSLNGGVLTISGTGATDDYEMWDANPKPRPWEQYADSIDTVVINEGITHIGACSFYNFRNLSNVQLPNSLKTINSQAFSTCIKLTQIEIPSGVNEIYSSAFIDCSDLKTVDIPNSVSYIGDYAFAFCKRLESVTLSENLEYLGTKAFYDCSELREIEIPGSLEEIGKECFFACYNLENVTIEEGVKTIGQSAFNSTLIAQIDIPCSIENIDILAFANCKNLKKILFNGDAPNYASSAFFNVTAYAYFPGDNASWNNADKLSNLIWIESLQIDGGSCGESVTYHIDGNVLYITGTGTMKDYSVSGYAPWYSLRDKITKIIISDGVTTIGTQAFIRCEKAKEVVIPESVTEIKAYAFFGCKELQTFHFPSNISTISISVLGQCISLEKLEIPKSVTYVDWGAFSECTSLKNIYFSGDAPRFDKVAFWGLESTVWYPANNDTWTETIKKNYEGHITWKMIGSDDEMIPTGPEPMQPAPTEPMPTDSKPVEPTSTEPMPTEPIYTEQKTTEPSPEMPPSSDEAEVQTPTVDAMETKPVETIQPATEILSDDQTLEQTDSIVESDNVDGERRDSNDTRGVILIVLGLLVVLFAAFGACTYFFIKKPLK